MGIPIAIVVVLKRVGVAHTRHHPHSGSPRQHSNVLALRRAVLLTLLRMISRLLFVLAMVFFAHGVEGTMLSVNNGRGGGEHPRGRIVRVSAGAPPAGQQFAGWTGDTAILANPSHATTSATIPSIDVSITATYKAISAEPATVAAVSPGAAGAPFAYVANEFDGSVSGYTIDPTTEALTPIAGSPFDAGGEPGSVAVDPSGKFVYVANENDNNVSGYTIDSTTGALTALAGSPFPAGTDPVSVAVDPSGKFVYVANVEGDNVSGYTIDPTTGALTPIAGSPFAPGEQLTSVAVDPSGKFAYATNLGDNSVSGYTIDPTTGALAAIAQAFQAGRAPQSVAVDPSGKFAYVANNGDNNVSGYTIDPTTGALTPIAGSPFAAGEEPVSVAVDPSGKFAYVVNSGDNNVSGYTIDPTTGALTAIADSPFPAGTNPQSVALTPSPSLSPSPGGNCHITVTVLGITRTGLFPPADVGDQWSFRFQTFIDEIKRVERIPAVGTMSIPFFPGAAGPGPFVLFSNLLPKAPSYNIRVLVVAHEDDTTDPAGRLTGLIVGNGSSSKLLHHLKTFRRIPPNLLQKQRAFFRHLALQKASEIRQLLSSQRGDDREVQSFEFGDVPSPSDTRLPRTIDVTRTAGGDADEANEPGATDRVRIRFRITLVDP